MLKARNDIFVQHFPAQLIKDGDQVAVLSPETSICDLVAVRASGGVVLATGA